MLTVCCCAETLAGPGAAVLFPPTATEARNEFQPHPGILFAWSSISGQAAGTHKQFAASNLRAVEREKGLALYRQKKEPECI